MDIVSSTFKLNLANLVLFAWLTLTMVKLSASFRVIKIISFMLHAYSRGLPCIEVVQCAGKMLLTGKKQHNKNVDANNQLNVSNAGDV